MTAITLPSLHTMYCLTFLQQLVWKTVFAVVFKRWEKGGQWQLGTPKQCWLWDFSPGSVTDTTSELIMCSNPVIWAFGNNDFNIYTGLQGEGREDPWQTGIITPSPGLLHDTQGTNRNMQLWWQSHSSLKNYNWEEKRLNQLYWLSFSLFREAFYENLSLLKVDKISHFEI